MLDNTKQWKVIPEFPMYFISEYGDIYSTYRSGKLLSPKLDKDGYKSVALSKDGKLHHLRVHRLVGITFIDNPNNLPVINHKDLDVRNNHISNLEWCTYVENTKHYYANGLGKRVLSSLTKEEMLLVVDQYKSGLSHKEIVQNFNLDCRPDAISEIVTGRRFSEITGITKPDDFKQRTTAKVDDALIVEILTKVHINNVPQKDICNEYKLSAAQVSRIVNGSRRREVYLEFMSQLKG